MSDPEFEKIMRITNDVLAEWEILRKRLDRQLPHSPQDLITRPWQQKEWVEAINKINRALLSKADHEWLKSCGARW